MCNSTRGDEPLYTQSCKFYLSQLWTTCPDNAWLPWSRHSYCREISPNTWHWGQRYPDSYSQCFSLAFQGHLWEGVRSQLPMSVFHQYKSVSWFLKTRELWRTTWGRGWISKKSLIRALRIPKEKDDPAQGVYWLPSESKWKTHGLHGHNFSINHVTSCIHLALTQKWFQWAKIKCYLSSNAEVLLIILITCKLHLYNSKYIITWECQ